MSDKKYRSPKEVWKDAFADMKSKIVGLIACIVIIDTLIVIGMTQKIEEIFIFFAGVCLVVPVILTVILVKEIKNKSAI